MVFRRAVLCGTPSPCDPASRCWRGCSPRFFSPTPGLGTPPSSWAGHRNTWSFFPHQSAEMNRLTLTGDTQANSSGNCPGSSPENPDCAHFYIRSALTYIYEHYTEPISIQELSAHCRISESHFRRLFKKVVGISPLEYIQHYRIQQACHLIYLNQEPINIIAQQTGYRSLSSFNRQFQQYMHSSPTHYRREHLLMPVQNEVLSYEDNATKHIFQI